MEKADDFGASFPSTNGGTIRTLLLRPKGRPKALIVFFHGQRHHLRSSDVYAFACKLQARGYAFYGMDWPGHGCSSSLYDDAHPCAPGCCNVSESQLHTDMSRFVILAVEAFPNTPWVVGAHSFGVTMALHLLPHIQCLPRFCGACFSAGGVYTECRRMSQIAQLTLQSLYTSANHGAGPESADSWMVRPSLSMQLLGGRLGIRNGFDSHLRALTCRIVFVLGEEDHIFSHHVLRDKIERGVLRDARLHVLPRRPHALLREAADEVVGLWDAYLEQGMLQ